MLAVCGQTHSSCFCYDFLLPIADVGWGYLAKQDLYQEKNSSYQNKPLVPLVPGLFLAVVTWFHGLRAVAPWYFASLL